MHVFTNVRKTSSALGIRSRMQGFSYSLVLKDSCIRKFFCSVMMMTGRRTFDKGDKKVFSTCRECPQMELMESSQDLFA